MATTAVLMSFISSLLPVMAYVVGFRKVFGAASSGIPLAHWALACLLLTSAASLASWATLHKSARRSHAGVIAQYTAE